MTDTNASNMNNISISDINASNMTNMTDTNASNMINISISDINASNMTNMSASGIDEDKKSLQLITNEKLLTDHIDEKTIKMNYYRRILELKYIKYKKGYNIFSIGFIVLSTLLTLIESWKLIFLDEENFDQLSYEFFNLSPILIGSIMTCTSTLLKFGKFQENMEGYYNVIGKCINIIAKLKNKKEIIITRIRTDCKCDNTFNEILQTYNDEILTDYYIIFQEAHKLIKTTDHDKYAKLLKYSDYNTLMIEHEKKLFFKQYEESKTTLSREEMDILSKGPSKKWCCNKNPVPPPQSTPQSTPAS